MARRRSFKHCDPVRPCAQSANSVTSYDPRKNAITQLDIRTGSIEIFDKIPAFSERIVEFYTNEIFFTACNRVKVQ
jgi:hypothetical protein